MNKLELTDDYKHFDTLIWQAPSVGIAIAIGAIVAASSIGEDGGQWLIKTEHVRASILLFGFFLLSALSVATAKFRLFQMASLDDFPKPPFGQPPSAGVFLQGSICLTNGVLFGLCLSEVFGSSLFVLIGAGIGSILWFLFELLLRKHRDSA